MAKTSKPKATTSARRRMNAAAATQSKKPRQGRHRLDAYVGIRLGYSPREHSVAVAREALGRALI